MKIIVITGASEGLGAEMARQLATTHGNACGLVLAARNAAALAAVAKSCQALGAHTLVVPTDVSVESQCRALIDATVARFGRIDVLVNNAGMSAQALLEQVQAADLAWYETLMRINHWGSVWCTHAALPHLKASRGSILAVSSLAGLVGVPGRTAYSATKFAMTGFFEALRTELQGADVGVTIAYPGVVATEIRRRGFNAQGQPAGTSGLKEDAAMPVATCARHMLAGLECRQREVLMTPRDKLARVLKLFWPALVDKMALAALNDEVKPR